MSKYGMEVKEFVLWDEFSSYMYGYILGDGTLKQETCKRGSITYHYLKRIEVKSRDEGLIIEMSKRLKGVDCSRSYKSKTGFIRRLNFTSEQWVRELLKLGINPNKSYNPLPLTMPKECMNHFIRGWFDSDGCVSVSNGYIQLYIAGNPIHLGCLLKEDKVNKWRIQIAQGCTQKLVICNIDDVRKFYNYIYHNSTISMKRKKTVFDQFMGDGLIQTPSY